MRRSRFCSPADLGGSAFSGFRFPPEVIVLAVRWYLRYGVSYRDLEELLAERGVEVDHVTLFRWVQRFTPLLVDAARPCRHAVSGRWFVDETYVKIAGVWRYVYRAVDGQGQGHCCIENQAGSARLLRMRRSRSCPPVDLGGSTFSGFRFPPDVIVLAVRWYLRYGLSYRDLEELLAERGIEVDHVTLFRWVQTFTPLLVDAARPCRHAGRRLLVRR